MEDFCIFYSLTNLLKPRCTVGDCSGGHLCALIRGIKTYTTCCCDSSPRLKDHVVGGQAQHIGKTEIFQNFEKQIAIIKIKI